MRFNRSTLAAISVVALAGIGTGSALAATGTAGKATTKKDDQQAALITALAGKLNITAADLKAALVATAKDRVAAELKAGTITQAQADAANARIDAGGALLGPIGGRGMGHRGGGPGNHLAAVATYLGVTQAELQTSLQSGKTLAAIATAQGKTAAGVEAALLADEKTEHATELAGLTAAQKTQWETDATARIKDMVENGRPAGGPGFGGRGGHGRHGGMGDMGDRGFGLGGPGA